MWSRPIKAHDGMVEAIPSGTRSRPFDLRLQQHWIHMLEGCGNLGGRATRLTINGCIIARH